MCNLYIHELPVIRIIISLICQHIKITSHKSLIVFLIQNHGNNTIPSTDQFYSACCFLPGLARHGTQIAVHILPLVHNGGVKFDVLNMIIDVRLYPDFSSTLSSLSFWFMTFFHCTYWTISKQAYHIFSFIKFFISQTQCCCVLSQILVVEHWICLRTGRGDQLIQWVYACTLLAQTLRRYKHFTLQLMT